MAHSIECDYSGCGRIEPRETHQFWFRLKVFDADRTTVWYCSPRCLVLDTLAVDAGSFDNVAIEEIRAAADRLPAYSVLAVRREAAPLARPVIAVG